jgi:hypothetical protein
VLCFVRTEAGEVQVVPGKEHRILRHWRGETSLDVLFASGVLG